MNYTGNPTEYTTKDHKERSKQKKELLSNLTLDWLDDDAADYLDKDILNNMKFVDIMANNMLSQPWLLNYELSPVDVGGKPGTVY